MNKLILQVLVSLALGSSLSGVEAFAQAGQNSPKMLCFPMVFGLFRRLPKMIFTLYLSLRKGLTHRLCLLGIE